MSWGYDGIVDTLSMAHELRNSDVQPQHDIGLTNENLTAVGDAKAIEHEPLVLFNRYLMDKSVAMLKAPQREYIP